MRRSRHGAGIALRAKIPLLSVPTSASICDSCQFAEIQRSRLYFSHRRTWRQPRLPTYLRVRLYGRRHSPKSVMTCFVYLFSLLRSTRWLPPSHPSLVVSGTDEDVDAGNSLARKIQPTDPISLPGKALDAGSKEGHSEAPRICMCDATHSGSGIHGPF